MRHKQILSVAEEKPGASIDELASAVPSATPELVERVFDEYGDPAAEDDTSPPQENTMSSTDETPKQEDSSDTGTAASDGSPDTERTDEQTISEDSPDAETESDEQPSLDELPEKQREVLRVIAARPEATQTELADYFDVTSATISRWVNDIEGFEWSQRESFVDAVVDEPPSIDALPETAGSATETPSADTDRTDVVPSDGGGEDAVGTAADVETKLESLDERLTELEESVHVGRSSDDAAFEDPELVHKIVHACMESDTISKAEELSILRELLSD
jgi:hypothetical protein